jgi:hypothetical protein
MVLELGGSVADAFVRGQEYFLGSDFALSIASQISLTKLRLLGRVAQRIIWSFCATDSSAEFGTACRLHLHLRGIQILWQARRQLRIMNPVLGMK